MEIHIKRVPTTKVGLRRPYLLEDLSFKDPMTNATIKLNNPENPVTIAKDVPLDVGDIIAI